MSKRYIVRPVKQKPEPQVFANGSIRARFVKVIGQDGQFLGEMSIREAIELSQRYDIDLVQLNGEEVPTCKLIELSKYLYERKKKQKERNKIARENAVDTKQIVIHITIDKNDLDRKLNEVKRFVSDGNNVRFVLQMRGREQAMKNDAFKLVNACIQRLRNDVECESPPKQSGNSIEVLFKPL